MANTPSSASTEPDRERDAALKRETIRNRVNQRAHRSRKQQYIRELEEQVRTFQREGVKATQEVQIAARHVATENMLLRKFVRTYAKCDDHDIDLLLAHMRNGSSEVPCGLRSEGNANSGVTGQTVSTVGVSRASPVHTVYTESRMDRDEEPLSALAPPPVLEESRSSPTTQTSTVTTCSCPANTATSPPPPKQTEHPLSTPTINKPGNASSETSPYDSESQQPSPTHRLPEDSISCEEAATIIAGLRLRNAEEAREELGCAPQGSCHIRNIALLQLMNETF